MAPRLSRAVPVAARLGRASPVAARSGIPGSASLAELSFLLESGEHAVEIVLLDTHLRRELRDGDAWLSLHERQRLCCARTTTFAPSGAASRCRRCGFSAAAYGATYFFGTADFFGATRPFFGGRCGFARATRATRSTSAGSDPGPGRPPDSAECPSRRLQATILLHQRGQLIQPFVISWRFSSRKSVTTCSSRPGACV